MNLAEQTKLLLATVPKRRERGVLHIFSAVKDKMAKGRMQPPMRGEANPRAILTALQVLAIREDKRKQPVIAAEYGISIALVKRIRARTIWTHI